MNFDYDIYDVNNYDYYLPENLIAQTPKKQRDKSKLLVLNRKDGNIIDEKYFSNIINYLHPGDVLIRNNSKVIPSRLFGIKEGTGAKVEILLLHEESKDNWECLVGNAKVVKVDTFIQVENSNLKLKCLEVRDEGLRLFKLIYDGDLFNMLEQIGQMPLPPYIHKKLLDKNRYQTTYAKKLGSSAAPTAGFHFTSELFNLIKEKGIEIVDVTLHVGLGTFKPVKVNDIRNHNMHYEYYEIDTKTCEILNLAKKEKRRIIPIGTTSTRLLESNLLKYGKFTPTKEQTNLFIYPGFNFKAVDGLITNFHLPKSTLLMLVCSFCSRENILKAYKHAVKNKYRFFSFGDAMLII